MSNFFKNSDLDNIKAESIVSDTLNNCDDGELYLENSKSESILDSKSESKSNFKINFKIRIKPIFKFIFKVRFKIRFTIRKQKLKLTRSSMYTKNA